MVGQYHYKAFISYSHRDRKIGERLHKWLERYKLPKSLVGKETRIGHVPARLGKIFRDREELPASDDLTTEIRKALEQSEFMIVLCSPNSASSRWVNREILDFKRVRGDKYVLPIIIDGEPFASNGDNPEAECFPPALRYKIGADGMLSSEHAEPIAADLRKFADGENRAFLKIVAGLTGVGLDEIVERNYKRKQRIVMAVTALSLLAVIVMSALTNEAVTARREAERQRAVAVAAQAHAEFQRGEAEGLIEFMLTELHDKLKSVGRLDALGAVGERAVGYYGGQILENMPDASVGRSARAFLLLGEVQNSLGNSSEALKMFERAAKSTAAALDRDPDNPERLFDHSQSVYYVGLMAWDTNDIAMVDKNWRAYLKYAEKMVSLEPDNIKWQRELGFANSNMGVLFYDVYNRPDQAIEYFNNAIDLANLVWSSDKKNINYGYTVANEHAWLADAFNRFGAYGRAYSERTIQKKIFEDLLRLEPNNKNVQSFLAYAIIETVRYEAILFNTYNKTSILEAVELAEDIHNFDLSNQRWLEQLTSYYLDLAYISTEFSDFETAIYASERVESLMKKLENKDIKPRGRNLRLSLDLVKAIISVLNKPSSSVEITQLITRLENLEGEATFGDNEKIILGHAYYFAGVAAENNDQMVVEMFERGTSILNRLDNLNPRTRILIEKMQRRLNRIDEAEKIKMHLLENGISKDFLSRVNY
ncbi:toll/interleukin-1 receptor domain-containing protein [Kordiimonas sp. SCSIO 12610]|uniref:toll/interleukin-1 receptor domain-containing protein n=1 Tax=Kordiimonas sp. SCSIO 12610 TaxID=2829597 RepID=UPI00210D6381|nr:toll/interleukin-1 receptor domain-containing protein [Kordiimonas sp. SCSIO 12610]UTW56334.1 toll/interleukin-1 receptor domain-containing protein [Kordiimonas sp. SCSIO 12610]